MRLKALVVLSICAGLGRAEAFGIFGGVLNLSALFFQTAAPPDPAVDTISGPNIPLPVQPIRATIANHGGQAVTTDVAIYRGDPRFGSATELGRVNVSIAAGAWVSLTSPVAYQFQDGEMFTLCVDPDRTTEDSNRNNNCMSHTVSTAYTDLKLTTVDLAITPAGADVGEPITVSAKVHNTGTSAAKTVMRLWQGHPLAPESVLLAQTQISVPARGQNVAVWTLLRPAGDTNLWVAAEDVVPREQLEGTNLASRNIFLKAIIDTGRRVTNNWTISTMPAVADLFGTGQPAMVFTEAENYDNNGNPQRGRVTAIEVYPDGAHKELWSKALVPDPSVAMTPAIADIDGDGSAEIIVEVVRRIVNENPNWGEIYVFALDRNGNTKWSHQWRTASAPCHMPYYNNGPVLGDMNGDGVADITIIEREIVTLDGRNGNELVRAPWPVANYCVQDAYSVVADVEGDGKNELVVGYAGIHVFNADGSVRWQTATSNIWEFALVDVEADGAPEVVIPVHRTLIEILDARTGAVKKRATSLLPYYRTIAATTSLLPGGLPALILSQNSSFPATAAYDGALNQLWFQERRFETTADNPMNIVLADVLGQGRPQVISRTDRRSIRIQDIRDGKFLFDPSIYGYAAQNYAWPAPVDVDGDGRAEIIVPYYGTGSGGTRLEFEPTYPVVDFLVFGSVHWGKLPMVWNQFLFNQQQVDSRLAWRNDYQPWKTHNTWRQQPVRKPCDLDQDDDIDVNDVNALVALRGTPVASGDPRDIDKDGVITVADSRACALKCTLANCTAINAPARILSLSPRIGYPGTSVTTTIRAEFAKFKQDVTAVSFGAGITVGPVTVLNENTLLATLAIAAGQTGQRTVTVSTAGIQATRINGFSLAPDNTPPVVHAGTGLYMTQILPATVSLSGTVSDDGLPAGGSLVSTWQRIAGPAPVQFADPTAPATSATFSAPGYYVLRLSASDGELFTVDDIGVQVYAGNQAPIVNAGGDRTTQLDVPITLAGSVQDDGLPFGSTVAVHWTQQSGPGTATFGTLASATTTATFSAVGTYGLRLSASDTQDSSFSDITITVDPPLPRLTGLAPDAAVPGQTRTITITGQYTHFEPGVTQAKFGAGVSVGGGAAGDFGPITVTGPTLATAQVSVVAGAALGPRSIGVRTGEELASAADAFTIGTVGVPNSIQIDLSEAVVAPGGSLTANPKVLDAAGNVLPYAPSSFQMQVALEQSAAAAGNAPVVSGLTITFPKLNKRVVNENPVEDPAGEFASGDPTDPNFGKETGGVYRLTVKLSATALSASTRIAALGSGTAEITLRNAQYAGDLGAVLNSLSRAMLDRDQARQDAGWEQLRQVDATLDFSADLLRGNNVLTPPNGYLIPAADMIAHGFRNGTDDSRFSRLLDSLISQSRSLRTRIDALSAAAITQADLDALRTAVAAYDNLRSQLAALKPTPLAMTQNLDKLNTLLPLESPRLLDAMKRKALEIMTLEAQSGGWGMVGHSATTSGIAPAMLRRNQVDFLSLFGNLFSIFTDLAGTAKGNIIELAFSLANDLANIAVANLVNTIMPSGSLDVSFVSAGSGFSFVCPFIPGTYVEGVGFNESVDRMAVAQIGCINSYMLRNLLTLRPSRDLAAAMRLISKIRSLVAEFARQGAPGAGIASDEKPDSIREGILDGCRDLVFNSGWQRVNQGRLPCVGVVIVFNLFTGGMRAVNADILADCN